MTSQSIKPNKGTIWFDKFVEEHKQEIKRSIAKSAKID